MAILGKTQTLPVVKLVDFGAYLDGGDVGEILLPAKDVPRDCRPGDGLSVFVYRDSEDRPIATTAKPFAEVGEFAVLKVVSVERVGAFLDWGLLKHLLLPFAEQSRDLRSGQKVVVYVYVDKSDRIAATMRLERNASKERPDDEPDREVDLLMFGKTELGYKAIVDGKYVGVLYANEVFRDLSYGQRLKGYIRKVRPDGKIDLALQPTGLGGTEELAARILEKLEDADGFLEITDKTSAEVIHDLFGVSKKKYKIALGGLYRKRLITVGEDGIRLVRTARKP